MAANNLANTKAEIFSALVQKEITDSISLAPLIEDLSELAVKGVNIVSVPKLSSFTVSERAFGAAGADNAPLTDEVDQILLNQNPLVKWNFDAADAMQSSIAFQMKAAERASSAHLRNSNAKIIAGMISVAGLSVNAAVPADITEDDFLEMRKYILDNEGDLAQTTCIIGTDMEKVMLQIPNFIRADYKGQGAPIVTGTLGTLYGVNVFVTTDKTFPTQQAIMVEKSGYGYAVQRAAKYAEQPNLDYGTDGVKAVVDMTWGHGGLQLGEGTAASGKSALVAKLRD